MDSYEDIRVGRVYNKVGLQPFQGGHAFWCGKVPGEDARPRVQEGADGPGGKGQTGHLVAWTFLCHPTRDSVHVRLQRRGHPAASHTRTMSRAERSTGAGSSMGSMLRL